jgi:hypothetical protein
MSCTGKLLPSLFFFAVLCGLQPATAQYVQQGQKLVGSGGIGQSFQGYSTALSADGNTAIVGGYFDNESVGAAWVFVRSNGVWTQEGSKLVGAGATGNAEQGVSVALSADGSTAIVGGPADNADVGAVWVFIRDSGVWVQQAELVGTGATANSIQGGSVALSADGNTAIVGGRGDNAFAGAVWIFTRSAGAWTQQGAKLVGSGAVGVAEQGWSVGLSGDGNTAVVGGLADNSNVGAAWVFVRSGTTWNQPVAKLVGTGGTLTSAQGSSVAISGDGSTIMVG